MNKTVCEYGGQRLTVDEYKRRNGVKAFERILKQLATDCASFQGGLCMLTGAQCSVLNDGFPSQQNRRCTYYERYVLPADKQTQADYMSVMEGGKVEARNMTECKRCIQPFKRRASNQIYCENCRIERRKESKRKSYHKSR